MEELEEEEVPQFQLRRSTRILKSNLKYANTTLIEDNGIRESSTYKKQLNPRNREM